MSSVSSFGGGPLWYYGAARDRDCERSERELQRQLELAGAVRDYLHRMEAARCSTDDLDEADSASTVAHQQASWLYGEKQHGVTEKRRRRQSEVSEAARDYLERQQRRREREAEERAERLELSRRRRQLEEAAATSRRVAAGRGGGGGGSGGAASSSGSDA